MRYVEGEPGTWVRRVVAILRAYWVAYVIVIVVTIQAALMGRWWYTIAWPLLLVVITMVFFVLIGRREVRWSDVVSAVGDGASSSATGGTHGAVLAGPLMGWVLAFVPEEDAPCLSIRARPAEWVRAHELRIPHVTPAEVMALIEDGTIGLLVEGEVVQRLRANYFGSRRRKPDLSLGIDALRE